MAAFIPYKPPAIQSTFFSVRELGVISPTRRLPFPFAAPTKRNRMIPDEEMCGRPTPVQHETEGMHRESRRRSVDRRPTGWKGNSRCAGTVPTKAGARFVWPSPTIVRSAAKRDGNVVNVRRRGAGYLTTSRLSYSRFANKRGFCARPELMWSRPIEGFYTVIERSHVQGPLQPLERATELRIPPCLARPEDRGRYTPET